jgi:hypothetical protein
LGLPNTAAPPEFPLFVVPLLWLPLRFPWSPLSLSPAANAAAAPTVNAKMTASEVAKVFMD